MAEPSNEQIRAFRLRAHHLDGVQGMHDVADVVGACGMQNSPPGAWETALHQRIPSCSLADMEHLLYREKVLLQAWSLRGAPVVFPVAESGTFLSALTPEEGEPWIYTAGIELALDFLQMSFAEVLPLVRRVMPLLDKCMLTSKSALDQSIAAAVLPFLPDEKKALWSAPSMYGSPDKQTVGGAVVSFLVRPCAFAGLVVFGERTGSSPTFTSYKKWVGHTLSPDEHAAKKLVRKFLHCYGPTTVDAFSRWLGCTGKQGRRLWEMVGDEVELVVVDGKKATILASDKGSLFSPPAFGRDLLLLGAHDPYLDQRDRLILQPDKVLHQSIWKYVGNPGAIVYRGEIVGIWTARKRGEAIKVNLTLWNTLVEQHLLHDLVEAYAAFRQLSLAECTVTVEVACA